MEVRIQPNKRYTFVGKTRSGKSFLSWFLLRRFSQADKNRQIIFIDPKHEHRKFGKGDSIDAPKLVSTYGPKARVQIFQTYTWTPELEKMVDNVLKRGNAIVVLDELGGIATATSVPVGITRLWTQGGGKGVGAWAMIQFPKRVPKVIKSQSEMFFMFRITDAKDRMDMHDYIPDKKIVEKALPKHFFWIYSDDMDDAMKVKPIKVPNGQKPV